MESITNTLSNEHADCDKQFVQAEESVAKKQWDVALTQFNEFRTAMEEHFAREQVVLFPRVEEHIGPTGPTQVMRMEHEQMRQVFNNMEDSLAQRDGEQYLGLSETLLMLMQQHNAKEEQILYPMSDQMLSGEVPSLLKRMFDEDGI
jgi:hemerythrin-like domain-containing protein